MRTARPFIAFIVATLGMFATLIAATLLSFRAQEGTMADETVGRCAGAQAKLERAAAQQSPKLLFIGGSAVHKGIDTGAVGEALEVRAANLGTFAALGPGVMLWNAKKVLRPGDTAVLVFEYDLFWHDRPTEPEIDYVVGCGGAYLDRLPLVEQVQYALGADPTRVLHVRRKSGANALEKELARLTPTGDAAPLPINFKPLSADQIERMKLYRPLDIRFLPESRDVRAIAAFIGWAKAHGVEVIAGWPNTLYLPAYDRDPGFAKIAAFYRSQGVPMIGQPRDTMVPLKYLHDTQYHLNEAGIRARTATTIRLLAPLVTGGRRP